MQNISAAVGSNVTIVAESCTNMWVRKGQIIKKDSAKYFITMDRDRGSSTLYIPKVGLDDEAVYRCQLLDGTTKGANLEIIGGFTYLYASASEFYIEGRYINSPYHTIPYEWMFAYNNPIYETPSDRNRVITDDSKPKLFAVVSTLTFHPAPTDDKSVVTCVTSHRGYQNGELSSDVLLDVYR
ncbi:hypothetical protein HELRODRAFT_166376 [Helobdella robusta]|uniref:Ig-like domain-containing protein n=1 Tax=Helobdella robusta TaxID=6412 RepID=T1EY25_HELRO|nr:hypothetical protein HELRODRAFT_166376 [Helobdella robusta]ESN90672.1 hypothetical protein HELRODRAFT_166376 [Helobdella robusta]